MNRYKLTLIGLAIAIIVYSSTIIFHVDLFEIVYMTFESFERFEIDEIIIPFMIFGVFTFFDQIRRQKLREIEVEKIKIYDAMISSSRHILDNFLNQMELFKTVAEATPGFDSEVLSLYARTIEEASIQVEELSNITRVDEASIHASVARKL